MTNNPGAGYFYSKKAQDKKKREKKEKKSPHYPENSGLTGAGRNCDGWLVCVRRYYLLCEWGEMAGALGSTPAGLREARTAVCIDLDARYLGLQERIKRQLIKKEGFMIFSPFFLQTNGHIICFPNTAITQN